MVNVAQHPRLIPLAALLASAVAGTADAQDLRRFDLASQPAETALPLLGRQAGLTVLARAADLRGVTTNRVSGSMTAQEAVRRLVAGTALTVRSFDGRSVTLARRAGGPPALGGSPDRRAQHPLGATSAAPTPVEDVVVTGIRSSQIQAVEMRARAPNLSEIVNAQDIGRMPDQNVVETLQRLSGAQITRVGGEGADFTIRGLSQNQLEFNGVLMSGVNGDGSARLREFNSEILAGLELVKTPSADRTEGALGGTVNLITKKPLDLAETLVTLRAQASHHDQARSMGRLGFVLASWRTEDRRTGVLFGGSWRDYARNDHSFNTDGWVEVERRPAGAPADTALYRPLRMVNNMVWSQDTQRSYHVSFQHRFDQDNRLGIDAALSSSSMDADPQRLQILLSDDWVNPAIGPGGTVVEAEYVSPTIRSSIYDHRAETEQFVSVVSFAREAGPWTLETRAAYSRGDRSELVAVPFLVPRPGLGGTVQTRFAAGADVPDYRLVTAYDPMAPSNWALLSAFETLDDTRSDSVEFKGDVLREIGRGWLSRIKAGFRIEDRTLSASRRSQNPTAAQILVLNPVLDRDGDGLIGVEEMPGLTLSGLPTSNFLAGRGGGIITDWLGGSVDYATFRSGVGLAFPPIAPASVREADLLQSAVYAMAVIDHTIGGLRVRGDAGARWVRIRREAGGYGLGDDQTFATRTSRFDYWLPSLNLALEVSDDLRLRLAVARVMASPPLRSVTPGLTLNVVRFTASRGNPDLRPFGAVQFDLAAEWRPSPFRFGSVNLYYKDIDSFTVTSQVSEYFENGVNSGFYVVSQPENGDRGQVYGLELNYKHIIDRPGSPLDGAGVAANYAFAGSRTPLTDPLTGRSEPMPLLSRHGYSLSVFVERGFGNVQLIYNWRDGFLEAVQTRAAGGNLYARAYGQLDASAQVQLTPRVRLELDLVNLTKEPIRTYVGVPTRVRQYEVNDRRIFFGLAATF